jgi:hypothetical protein
MALAKHNDTVEHFPLIEPMSRSVHAFCRGDRTQPPDACLAASAIANETVRRSPHPQRVDNTWDEVVQPDEHQSIDIAENNSLRGFALPHIDLLPKNQDFRLKPHLQRNKQACTRPQ